MRVLQPPPPESPDATLSNFRQKLEIPIEARLICPGQEVYLERVLLSCSNRRSASERLLHLVMSHWHSKHESSLTVHSGSGACDVQTLRNSDDFVPAGLGLESGGCWDYSQYNKILTRMGVRELSHNLIMKISGSLLLFSFVGNPVLVK